MFNHPLCCCSVLLACLVVTQSAYAQEKQTPAVMQVNWQQQWEASQERIASLESRMEAMDSNGDWGSDCCVDSCCECGPQMYAGYSFLFAKPQMKESFQATVTNAGNSTLSLVPFENDYELTPRVWLGYKGDNGLGVKLQYWQYDHAGQPLSLVSDGVNWPGASVVTVIYPAAILAPGAGDVLSVNNGLDVQTLDLEGTLDLQIGCTELTVAGGVRYARIKQDYRATANRGQVVIGDLQWTREFEGFGPMMSGVLRHPLGCNGLYAIGSARGSLLFGDKNMRRSVIGDVTPAPQGPANVSLVNADEVTGAFEVAIGAEWVGNLTETTQIFLQATYEAQLWTSAGAPTLTFLGFEGFGLSLGVSR